MNLVFIRLILDVATTGMSGQPHAPALEEAYSAAMHGGFIGHDHTRSAGFILTEKGQVYIDALKAIKEPVETSTWAIPA